MRGLGVAVYEDARVGDLQCVLAWLGVGVGARVGVGVGARVGVRVGVRVKVKVREGFGLGVGS